MAMTPGTMAFMLEASRSESPDVLGQFLEGCRAYLLMVSLQAREGYSDLVQETVLEGGQFHAPAARLSL